MIISISIITFIIITSAIIILASVAIFELKLRSRRTSHPMASPPRTHPSGLALTSQQTATDKAVAEAVYPLQARPHPASPPTWGQAASLPKGVKPEDLKLDDALGLLRLPRLLGEHPENGKVQAGLGRFGPYVVWDKGKGEKDYRSLKGDDDVLSVGLSRALELLAMPKRGRGGRTALKDLGKPEGSEETVQVFDGPYGLYVNREK